MAMALVCSPLARASYRLDISMRIFLRISVSRAGGGSQSTHRLCHRPVHRGEKDKQDGDRCGNRRRGARRSARPRVVTAESARRSAVLAGGAVGAYMDHQESKLREQLQGTGVSVTRAGRRSDPEHAREHHLRGGSVRHPLGFYDVLNSVVLVVKEFDKTNIEVSGYTDSTGIRSIQPGTLAPRRERGFLLQVAGCRWWTRGFGERYAIRQ